MGTIFANLHFLLSLFYYFRGKILMVHISNLNRVGLQWAACYIYHYMISKIFLDSVLLNMVNVLAAIITSAYFISKIHLAVTSHAKQQKADQPDLLAQASYVWQIVLAGTVILSLIIRNNT